MVDNILLKKIRNTIADYKFSYLIGLLLGWVLLIRLDMAISQEYYVLEFFKLIYVFSIIPIAFSLFAETIYNKLLYAMGVLSSVAVIHTIEVLLLNTDHYASLMNQFFIGLYKYSMLLILPTVTNENYRYLYEAYPVEILMSINLLVIVSYVYLQLKSENINYKKLFKYNYLKQYYKNNKKSSVLIVSTVIVILVKTLKVDWIRHGSGFYDNIYHMLDVTVLGHITDSNTSLFETIIYAFYHPLDHILYNLLIIVVAVYLVYKFKSYGEDKYANIITGSLVVYYIIEVMTTYLVESVRVNNVFITQYVYPITHYLSNHSYIIVIILLWLSIIGVYKFKKNNKE